MILKSWSHRIIIMLTEYQMIMSFILHIVKMDYFRPIYSKIHVEPTMHEVLPPVAAKRQ